MLDGITGVHTKDMAPRLQSAAIKAGVSLDGNSVDSQAEARLVMANQRLIYKLMSDIGINDFSIMDIIKPEPERTRRILSALINFARFRASPTTQWYSVINAQDLKSQEYDQMLLQRDELRAKIDDMALQQPRYLARKTELEGLKTQSEQVLRKLMETADVSGQEQAAHRRRKADLIKQLQERKAALEEEKKRVEHLQKYVMDPEHPPSEVNRQLNNTLSSSREKLEGLERRIRGLEVSTETFRNIKAEVEKCIKIINGCQIELRKEDEALKKLANCQEMYDRSKLEASELDRSSQQLTRRLKATEDKIERVRQQMDRKKEAARKRMVELQDQYLTLIAERSVADQDMERVRNNIKRTEEEMSALKQEVEAEVREFESESQRLNACINAYLNDMDRKISYKK